MSDATDRPNTIYWPPLLDATTALAAWGLHRWAALPALLPQRAGELIGWPLMAIGLCIGAAAILSFRGAGTSVDPTARAGALATAGIYRATRNPMYLGTLLAFGGAGLAFGITWLIVLLVPLAFGLTKLAIEREEAYLERRFGAPYASYKSRVRRWI